MVTTNVFDRLAAIVLLMLLASLPLPANAQGGGIHYSREDTRHFEGERFITLANVRVHARPSTDSEIVRDIPRMRMVYAKPSAQAGWLEVFGAGVEEHPYRRQGILDPVGVKNGKLVLNLTRIDRNVYRRFSGYVAASGLGSLDHPLPLPEQLNDQMVPIPGPLESIGVPERRFVPRHPLEAPFRSVLRISIGEKTCTGFVVEKPGLIATSGHCFDNGQAGQQVSVMVPSPETGYRKSVPLPARIVYWVKAKNNGGGDSALLEVTDSRILEIPPLALATPGPWLQAGAIRILTVGHGEDLLLHKWDWAKSDAVPHADVCTLSAGQAGMTPQLDVLHFITTNLDCVAGPGDSGGPMLFFNPSSNRYEVLGLTTWGNRSERRSNAMSNGARKLLEETRQSQSRKYDGEIPAEVIQGMATLRKLIDNSSSTYQVPDGWLLDERLYREVATQTGRPSTFKGLLDGLVSGPSSMIAMKDEVTYLVNNQWKLDDFRQARLALSLPLPAAGAKQARETYGDRLIGQSLREQGVITNIFRFGRVLELGDLMVPESEIAEYAKALQPKIDALIKEKPDLIPSVNRVLIETVKEMLMVEVGPDLYVVKEGAKVTEVIRNWMRDFKNSPMPMK